MTAYSVADAKNRLPALIAAAERGEAVTITRYGKPVAELRPIAPAIPVVTPDSIDWIEQQLADLPTMPDTGATLIDQLREESEH